MISTRRKIFLAGTIGITAVGGYLASKLPSPEEARERREASEAVPTHIGENLLKNIQDTCDAEKPTERELFKDLKDRQGPIIPYNCKFDFNGVADYVSVEVAYGLVRDDRSQRVVISPNSKIRDVFPNWPQGKRQINFITYDFVRKPA